MTTSRKLEFLLRAIVTAGGPERKPGVPDEVYTLEVTQWLMKFVGTGETNQSPKPTCSCREK